MFRNIISVTLATVLLVGCASAENRQLLASEQDDCTRGNAVSCQLATQQAARNQQEASENALKAAGVMLLVPLLVLGAAAEANTQPDVIVVTPSYRRW